jgi:hypothetical protein
MPALRFVAGTRSSKDNRFRPTEEMNARDPNEALVSSCCRSTRDSENAIHRTPRCRNLCTDRRPSRQCWRNFSNRTWATGPHSSIGTVANDNVLYHSLLGLASGERFWKHSPEMATPRLHRFHGPRFTGLIAQSAPEASHSDLTASPRA